MLRGFRHFLPGAALLSALSLGLVARGQPLDEASAARREGDASVLAALTRAGASRDTRLAAIRHARWLRMPELALAPLATIAAGRDPVLAPEAAFVAHAIATSLDPLTLEAHEVPLASLHDGHVTLKALARDATARADIRALASFAARALAALGVP